MTAAPIATPTYNPASINLLGISYNSKFIKDFLWYFPIHLTTNFFLTPDSHAKLLIFDKIKTSLK